MKGRIGNTVRRIGATILLVSAASPSTAAQFTPDPDPPELIVPRIHGDWDGPFVLPLNDDYLGEIVHAAVLPPPTTDLGAERVVLSCRTEAPCTGGTVPTGPYYGRTYLWDGRPAGNVDPIPVPASYPTTGEQDFFCAGHTFLADGSWLVVGGTNLKTGCAQGEGVCCWGHDQAWRLDTSTAIPQWFAASVIDDLMNPNPLLNHMKKRRWYPTATLLNDGSVYVHGHSGTLIEPPGTQGYLFRDRYVPAPLPSLGTWQPLVQNRPWLSCPAGGDVNVHDYARLHLLSTGVMVFGDAYTNNPAHDNAPTKFLDVKPQPSWPSCSEPRWRSEATIMPQDLHVDGSSLHFITYDDAGSLTETVYLIGGNIEGEGACDGTGVDAEYLRRVERLTNPDPTVPSLWQAVDSMIYRRANHNAVIGLDGAIYVIGGQARQGGACVFQKWGEMYRPPEVFDGVTGMSIGQWVYLAKQSDVRQYHSVANVLPSGKIISAGGVGENEDDPSEKSIEVFTPAYLYTPGRAAPDIVRASLQNPHTAPYAYTAQSIDFQVQLDSTAVVDRVALVRNGNSTHAFDSDQRYVELRHFVLPVPVGGGLWNIRVIPPVDAFMAPPGFYMLTVTDDAQVASAAEWIRLQ